MKVSQHNYFFTVNDGKEVIVYNPLSGSIDISPKEDMEVFDHISKNELESVSDESMEYLVNRGYVCKEDDGDEQALAKAYEEYHEQLLQCPIKFTFSLTYDCNARCPYCYIGENLGTDGLIKPEMVDKAFEFVKMISDQRDPSCPKHITLFGGDPLVNTPAQRAIVEKILRMSKERGYEVDAVTNGYDLSEYADMLAEYGVKVIQVTFQGTKQHHNKQRIAVDRKGDGFTRLVKSVDDALAKGIEINCRILLDKGNIGELPEMVKLFREKGWSSSPLFRTHIGTVFDTFGCMPDAVAMQTLDWKQANEQLIQIVTKDRSIVDAVGLDWRGMKRFMRTGKLFEPNFKHCVAGVNAFALDCRGDLYVCQVSLGQQDFKVGSYYPEIKLNDKFARLADRSILNIGKCQSCPQSLLCGGGCPIISWLKTGSIFDAGCVNLKETMQFGFDFYWPDIKARIEGGGSCCSPEPTSSGLMQMKRRAAEQPCAPDLPM